MAPGGLNNLALEVTNLKSFGGKVTKGKAVDDWVFKTPGLRALLLSEDEKTLAEIADVLEPFAEVTLEVTLQMSHSKVPTIPFVLPLYQKMEHHLKAVSFSLEHSFKVQHAAEKGLEKLRKYSAPAKLHHTYILGTVLHPCLRSHWFEALKGPDNAAAQREAITNAEVVFRYVAETYLETSPASTPSTVPRPQPVTKTSSFLQVARACSFQRPITAATSIPTSKRTPKEELDEELTRYFSFESEPIERQEGEEGSHEEPTAQEVLLNPLLGWKKNASEFPTIARMAQDYLAIPATSVSVERVFSKSRHICGNLRSSLKEKTITMALLTKAWIRSGLFEMMPLKIQRRKHGENELK